MVTALNIAHRPELQRFEADLGDGERAMCVYRREGDRVLFTHTEVPPRFEGQGIAAQLVAAALDWVRREGLQAVPLCSYVASYLRRHPEPPAARPR